MIGKMASCVGESLAGVRGGVAVLIGVFRTVGIPVGRVDGLVEQGVRELIRYAARAPSICYGSARLANG